MIAIYCLKDGAGCIRYIGKTKKLVEIRRAEHWRERKKTRDSYRKCWLNSLPGPPQIEVLVWCLPMHWQQQEREWILLARAYGCRLVNTTDGGDGIHNPSPEVRAKMSAAKKGKSLSAAHRAKITASNTGRKMSEAQRLNLIAVNTGKSPSAETREKMAAAKRGRVLSLETRRRMSEASPRRKMSESNRVAVRAANLGKHPSVETRKKMAAAHRGVCLPLLTRQHMVLAQRLRRAREKGETV